MSARRPSTWMPFFIGDYLADTMHLTRDEHGAYMLLIMAYWRNGGPLEGDGKILFAITKSTEKEWQKLRPVMAKFFTIKDGKWHHKRCDRELRRAWQNFPVNDGDNSGADHWEETNISDSLSARRAAAGAKGAAKRWQTDSKTDGKPIANEMTNDGKQIAKPMANNGKTHARVSRPPHLDRDSIVSPESESPRPSESAQAVGEAFEEAIRNLWPNDCQIRPTMNTEHTAQKWLDQGMQVTEAIGMVRTKLLAAKDRGMSVAPKTMEFLKDSAQDLIDRKSGGRRANGHTSGEPEQSTEAKARDRRRRQIQSAAAYLQLDHWALNSEFGADPRDGPRFCQLDADVMAWARNEGPMPDDARTTWNEMAAIRPDLAREAEERGRRRSAADVKV